MKHFSTITTELMLAVFLLSGTFMFLSETAHGSLPLCSELPPDELPGLCIPDGSSGLPSCSSVLDQPGAACTDPDGNSCFVLESGGAFSCPDIIVGQCQHPSQIVQDCVAGGLDATALLFQSLTDDAVGAVIRNHQLPDSDAPLVMQFARNSVRAHLFDSLLGIIGEQQRSAEEQGIVDYYSQALQSLRIRQVRASEIEYDKFAADPCIYSPPEGFEFDGSSNCASPLSSLFGTSAHPSFEEFMAYGIGDVARGDILDDPEALQIAGGTRNAIILGGSIVGAAVVAGAVGLLLFSTSLGAILVSVTAPYAVIPFAGTAITGLVGGIVGIAGAVGIALFAIVGSVLIVIQFANYQEFLDQIESLDPNATEVPDLRAEIATERGVSDFYQIYIKSTQPEWPPGPVPAPAIDAPRFLVKDSDGNEMMVTTAIDLAASSILTQQVNQSSISDLRLNTRLHGGWFVPEVNYVDGTNVVDEASLSLFIDFVDWDGHAAKASRSGTTFLILQENPDGSLGDAIVTQTLHYLDQNGLKLSASIVNDVTPPDITPVVTGTLLNDSGWFVSDINLSWTIDEPESEVLGTTGCMSRLISQDGIWPFTCEASSAGGDGTRTVEVKRDTQPPTITATVTPTPNAQGWNNETVLVTYACQDAMSGVAQCPVGRTLEEEGRHVVPAGFAVDMAGNKAFGASLGVSIDTTSPVVTIETPADGAQFVTNQSVDASWQASDALSGVLDTTATAEDAAPLDTSTAGDHVFTVRAHDKAGNEISVSHTYSVLTPAQKSAIMRGAVVALGLGNKIEQSLTTKLDKVVADFSRGDNRLALNRLTAFANQLRALAGKKVRASDAEALLYEVQVLMNVL